MAEYFRDVEEAVIFCSLSIIFSGFTQAGSEVFDSSRDVCLRLSDTSRRLQTEMGDSSGEYYFDEEMDLSHRFRQSMCRRMT
jgi:hypothetical protein